MGKVQILTKEQQIILAQVRDRWKVCSVITTLLFDFSRVLIFPKDASYTGKLNELYRQIIRKKNYNFFDYFVLNNELLEYVKTLKNKYILTIYTTDILQDDPAVKPMLDKIFSEIFAANALGINKKESEGYKVIAEKLGVRPEEIVFIDDTKENIDAAKKSGLQVIQFTSNINLRLHLEGWLR